MAPKSVSPAIDETAFSCPHCGALATQYWYHLYANGLKSDQVPSIWTSERAEGETWTEIADKEERVRLKALVRRMATGRPFFNKASDIFLTSTICNLHISSCYNCKELSIWRYDGLIWPAQSDAPEANGDLPTDIRDDYDEAGRILAASPRGAAALLRLCIQKLCIHLGEKGKKIDDDIASMVKKGLNVRVQQALDIVRVVGNEAVHPGQLDLKDDRATAEELFGLVNLVADAMISQPKRVEEIYAKLPAAKRDAIAKRDGVTPTPLKP